MFAVFICLYLFGDLSASSYSLAVLMPLLLQDGCHLNSSDLSSLHPAYNAMGPHCLHPYCSSHPNGSSQQPSTRALLCCSNRGSSPLPACLPTLNAPMVLPSNSVGTQKKAILLPFVCFLDLLLCKKRGSLEISGTL